MKVHAFRRNPTEVIDVDFAGQVFKFKANEKGDVVADLPADVAEKLIEAAGCGYRAYEAVDAPVKAAKVAPAPAPAAPPAAAPASAPSADLEPPSGDSSLPPAGDLVKKEAPPASPFVIESPDGVKYDLGSMSDAEVREFAVKAGLAKPHHAKKGDGLRQFVIDALKAD